MKCPIDQSQLQVTDRQGIEIDWCPTCRGIWLDRGELDKIIERSAAYVDSGRSSYDDDDDRYERRRDDDRYERYEGKRDDRDHPQRRRKKRSFLDDLFDFD